MTLSESERRDLQTQGLRTHEQSMRYADARQEASEVYLESLRQGD